MESSFIVGAGMAGLAASWISGRPAFEACPQPGGLCRSYYMRPGDSVACDQAEGAYRFERGGGHWVFGGDSMLNLGLAGFGSWRRYERRASVYFPESRLFVPYPLQYNLHALDSTMAEWAYDEMRRAPSSHAATMAGSIEQSFGATLTDLFFGPFHELYTAGLWREIAPQDDYKSPVDLAQVEAGMRGQAGSAGYNGTFLYPEGGLSRFADALAARGDIRCSSAVAEVDVAARKLRLADGSSLDYTRLVSTLPLDLMLKLCGLQVGAEADPSTAVLVLNAGGVRGSSCPGDHWVYVPRSRAGFHRVGFYSNVDADFLPAGADNRVSIYVERAFRSPCGDVAGYTQAVIDELREWGWLEEVEAVDASWVEVAYTWRRPGSQWRAQALQALSEAGIEMTGRYGKWKFQGIADSLRDGILAGAALKARE